MWCPHLVVELQLDVQMARSEVKHQTSALLGVFVMVLSLWRLSFNETISCEDFPNFLALFRDLKHVIVDYDMLIPLKEPGLGYWLDFEAKCPTMESIEGGWTDIMVLTMKDMVKGAVLLTR